MSTSPSYGPACTPHRDRAGGKGARLHFPFAFGRGRQHHRGFHRPQPRAGGDVARGRRTCDGEAGLLAMPEDCPEAFGQHALQLTASDATADGEDGLRRAFYARDRQHWHG